MNEALQALLEHIRDPAVRAAISAGWELGSGLPVAVAGHEKAIMREAASMSRKMHLDAEVVSGAALLAMALCKHGL